MNTPFFLSPQLENNLINQLIGDYAEVSHQTVYHPGPSDYRFNLGVSGCAFHGKLYIFWKSSLKDEDTQEDTVVRYSVSEDDGQTWSSSHIFVPSMNDGFLRSSASCYSDGKQMVVYIQKVTTYYGKGDTFTEYYTTHDGIAFEGPFLLETTEESSGQAVPLPAACSGPILVTSSGRLIMGFQGNINCYGRRQFVSQMYYSDCSNGIHGWKKALLPLLERPNQGQGVEIEAGYYQRSSGEIVVAFRDMENRGSVLASISADNGATYSLAVPTNLPDSGSMQCGGIMPDGRSYLVNNPTPRQRIPLAVHFSHDGLCFTESFQVRSEKDLQPRRYEGLYKTPGYSYPSSFVYKGSLYIFYATNKEDIEVSILK